MYSCLGISVEENQSHKEVDDAQNIETFSKQISWSLLDAGVILASLSV